MPDFIFEFICNFSFSPNVSYFFSDFANDSTMANASCPLSSLPLVSTSGNPAILPKAVTRRRFSTTLVSAGFSSSFSRFTEISASSGDKRPN
jgi:hypothetical protein